MNVFKSLMLFLALSMSTARPGTTTFVDPFQTGGNLQFATDFAALQGYANQDAATFLNYLNAFVSDYYNINSGYDSTITPTLGDSFVTMLTTFWNGIKTQINPALSGAIQSAIATSPVAAPSALVLANIDLFAGILATGIPGAQFLSSTQLATIQNTINGPTFNAPTPVASTAAGTVNGVFNNYYFLCPSITTLVTGTTATTKVVTTGKKTVTVKKPAPAPAKKAKTTTVTKVVKHT